MFFWRVTGDFSRFFCERFLCFFSVVFRSLFWGMSGNKRCFFTVFVNCFWCKNGVFLRLFGGFAARIFELLDLFECVFYTFGKMFLVFAPVVCFFF